MRHCDLCNSDLQEVCSIVLGADDMRAAAMAGLRPRNNAVFQLLQDEEADRQWLSQVETDTTGWALCPACADEAMSFLTSPISREQESDEIHDSAPVPDLATRGLRERFGRFERFSDEEIDAAKALVVEFLALDTRSPYFSSFAIANFDKIRELTNTDKRSEELIAIVMGDVVRDIAGDIKLRDWAAAILSSMGDAGRSEIEALEAEGFAGKKSRKASCSNLLLAIAAGAGAIFATICALL